MSINLVNAGLRGVHRVPQPFLNYLSLIALNDTVLPDGYVNQSYSFQNTYSGGATAVITSGSLPPGLSMSFAGTVFTITGTPTTVGFYTFTVQFTVGVTVTSSVYHINIDADPSGGGAFISGI